MPSRNNNNIDTTLVSPTRATNPGAQNWPPATSTKHSATSRPLSPSAPQTRHPPSPSSVPSSPLSLSKRLRNHPPHDLIECEIRRKKWATMLLVMWALVILGSSLRWCLLPCQAKRLEMSIAIRHHFNRHIRGQDLCRTCLHLYLLRQMEARSHVRGEDIPIERKLPLSK